MAKEFTAAQANEMLTAERQHLKAVAMPAFIVWAATVFRKLAGIILTPDNLQQAEDAIEGLHIPDWEKALLTAALSFLENHPSAFAAIPAAESEG